MSLKISDITHARHRCRIIQARAIVGRVENLGRTGHIKVEVTRLASHCLIAPPEQEAGHPEPLLQVLMLEPFLELRLPTGRDIVEDCENAGPRDGHVRAQFLTQPVARMSEAKSGMPDACRLWRRSASVAVWFSVRIVHSLTLCLDALITMQAQRAEIWPRSGRRWR